MRYSPISPNFPHLWHGGDYNPEQWTDVPGVWEEDYRLANLAGVNALSVGIFAWAALEPSEGVFDFAWLDRVLDNLQRNGQRVVLATPSGAKPNWLALKYEQVRRVDDKGHREPQKERHNHCPTSPIYREKVRLINTKLAERYKDHPAILAWHISNEFGGHCHCGLCFAAFQEWLKERYRTPEAMTQKWWARFWSHTFRSFAEVTTIDHGVHGLVLAWKRFHTDQVCSFIRNEAAPLRALTPGVPITTNFMGTYEGFDYWKLAQELDFVCWDSYPDWHGAKPVAEEAQATAFVHDIYRAMKGGKPWMLMESTPSQTNWRQASSLKRPGVHRLASLQAVAHGSDGVMYFQFRKSRGSGEKFHGAIVDHVGHEHTRVFADVAEVGAELKTLDAVVGTTTKAQVAVIFDWENHWAIAGEYGPRHSHKEYVETAQGHHAPFWARGIGVDVIDSTQDFSKYKLVIAPMLYMLRPGVAERLETFVAGGGTLVMTYFSGLVDEDDLCFLGGVPGAGLRKVLGIWAEETDALPDGVTQSVVVDAAQLPRLTGSYAARHYCDLIHAEGAQVLATYGSDFYAGRPAVTVNRYGSGKAYYVASRNDAAFTDGFLGAIAEELKLKPALSGTLPAGVTAQVRSDGVHELVFLLNFNADAQEISLGSGVYRLAGTGKDAGSKVQLPGYGVVVLERAAN